MTGEIVTLVVKLILMKASILVDVGFKFITYPSSSLHHYVFVMSKRK